MIYLDNAATTMPKPLAVIRAAAQAMETCGGLGRGGHEAAQRAADVAYACRKEAGDLFDTEPEQVVFTMNATHGLNLAIRSLVSEGDEVIISGFEHNAVLRPLFALGAKIRVAGRKLYDPLDMILSMEGAISSQTKAVICTHVSNVFGFILPLEEISAICRRKGIPLIIDASQSAGILPLSMDLLQPAFAAMPGHKGLLGPQGTGLLLCGDRPLCPIMFGGTGSKSQSPEMPEYLPDRGEAGTQNIHGIAGLLAGIRHVKSLGYDAINKHEQQLTKHLFEQLSFLHTNEVFYGGSAMQTGVISIRIEDYDCEIIARRLSDDGIAVRAGLHCAPLAHDSAGTLQCGTVRISFSMQNTETETAIFAESLQSILGR